MSTKKTTKPLSLLADKGMRLYLASAAFRGILAKREEGSPLRIGLPCIDGEEVVEVKLGVVLRDIAWTGNDGNSMWDGALLVLDALAIDPAQPL